MIIDWCKCEPGVWCNLNKVDADHKNLKSVHGVYILWHGDVERTILLIGYGNIREEIVKNKNDIAVQAFSHLGVNISWAEVSSFKKKSVLAFLYNKLKPKIITDDPPKGSGTEVNLPWEEII